MIQLMFRELVKHAPFTLVGAFLGVLLAFMFRGISHDTAESLFNVLHPLHVFISAVATVSLYRHYERKTNDKNRGFVFVLLIGLLGSLGVGTLSDSLIPYFGESLFGIEEGHAHIGFIELWWIVNPLAIIGVLIGYFLPIARHPHTFHVLLSTWASMMHLLMEASSFLSTLVGCIICFFVLFFAVWLPCCFSDILFPIFWVRDKQELSKHIVSCHDHHGG